jgi:hypothetical protein
MVSDVARRVAETILEDRRKDGHYRDPEKLSHYLLGSFAPGSFLYEEARLAAEAVLASLDQNGEDVDELAELIDTQVRPIREKASGSS